MPRNRFLTLTFVAAFASAAAAAPVRREPAAKEPEESIPGPDPKMELEHYSRALSLDKPQRGSVLAVLKEKVAVLRLMERARRAFQARVAETQQRIRKLNATFSEEIARMEKIQASSKAKLRGLLTPEQQKLFDDMEKERERYEAEFRRIQEEKARREREAGQQP